MAQLVLSVTKTSVPIGLTGLNTTDWAQWGNSSVTPLNRKNGGGSLISAATYTGGTPTLYINDPRTISWTDGTPNATGSNTNGDYNFPPGTGANAGVGYGFEVTFPADTSIKEAQFYSGFFSCTARVTAIISDASTANQVDSTTLTIGAATSSNGVIVVTYSAASAGQTMKIRIEVLTASDATGFENVTLQAATVKTLAVPCPIYYNKA
jgi:hypothetical protein